MAATVCATATAVGVSAPAQAAPQCNFTRTVCLFDATGYSGNRLTLTSLTPGGTCVSLLAAGWGGRARSALNTGTTSAALFANDNCVGGPLQIPPGGGVSNLGSFAADSVWVP
ncbi:hypothetical protein GCM10018962_42370 [Dactylosporangium matsuzakiense]|uniref:Peptidase inhibitor family I36 n=2 Tax=Dactylosporangium matsuzakiense TaxID=53360 RepID=A0A9W6KSI7_9ACTN|nr:hypothetical protein GCM10017581_090440 [Dactylosporangium matsuzakiense]